MIIKDFLQRQYAPPDAAAGGAVDRGDSFIPTGADAGQGDDDLDDEVETKPAAKTET
jgi:hypothetical protein